MKQLEQVNAGSLPSLTLFLDRVREALNAIRGRSMQAMPTLAELVEQGVITQEQAEAVVQGRR